MVLIMDFHQYSNEHQLKQPILLVLIFLHNLCYYELYFVLLRT
nr:MAG TPA: hypothetical protein [Crassvirales sp.]